MNDKSNIKQKQQDGGEGSSSNKRNTSSTENSKLKLYSVDTKLNNNLWKKYQQFLIKYHELSFFLKIGATHKLTFYIHDLVLIILSIRSKSKQAF